MKISASLKNKLNQHSIIVQTNDSPKQIEISPKSSGLGSSVNGAELLLVSLATCFCNDIYREASKRNLIISAVEVDCEGEFGADGETGKNFRYKVNVTSDASPSTIEDLIKHTDRIAEIHNTLRNGIPVTLIS